MPHADEGTLHAYLDGALEGPAKAQVQQHLAACHDCRVALEEARALIGQAAKILEGGRPAVEAVAPPLAAPAPRRRRMIPLAWAASLAVALAAGWFARSAFRSDQSLASRSPQAESVDALALREEAMAETVGMAPETVGLADEALVAAGRAAEPSVARDEDDVAAKATVAESLPRAASPRVRQPPSEPVVAAVPRDTQPPRGIARRERVPQLEEVVVTAAEPTRERRADAPPAGAQLAPRAGEAAADVAPPPIDTLPGFNVARLAREGGVTTVHHVSPAGDTVMVRYESPASPGDTTRVFQEGLVLARDAAGRPRLVVGVYRLVGPYRVTATGTVARDSLAALLGSLVSRSP